MANQTCAGTFQGRVLTVSILLDQVRDAKVAHDFRDDIIALINREQPKGIVIDLAKVKFIGSVGLLAFLGVRRQLSGGRIVLCNLSDPIREMFSVCRLIATDTKTAPPFETANTTAEALAQLSA